jgi:hypothetical protein
MFIFYLLSHNGCTAGNFDLHDHGFLLLTWSTGPMECSTGNSYQAEALTNVLRYHTCRSNLPEDRKYITVYLCFHPLPVPMAARITKYLNKYVCRDLCLIYMFSFYFWNASLARKMRKTNMRYYPEYPSLFTPIKGRIDILTVNIYNAETCTNILRYNTCMSSYPGDRKRTKVEP